MTQTNICEPLRPARTGYRRSWTDLDRTINNVTGDPIQPKYEVVTQKVSGIEYNVWNGDYKRSWTPSDIENNQLSGSPTNPDIFSGWNADYKRSKTPDDIANNPISSLPNPELGLSRKFVEQSSYRGFFILKDGVPDEKMVYDEYVSHDVCNLEVYLDGDTAVDGNGNPLTTIFVEDATLCLEGDRDNILKTEFSFQAIKLEDNTTVSHIDYTGDYFVREEDEVSLNMEQGGLIEPYGL